MVKAKPNSTASDPVHGIVYQDEAKQFISCRIHQAETVIQQEQGFVVDKQAGKMKNLEGMVTSVEDAEEAEVDEDSSEKLTLKNSMVIMAKEDLLERQQLMMLKLPKHNTYRKPRIAQHLQ